MTATAGATAEPVAVIARAAGSRTAARLRARDAPAVEARERLLDAHDGHPTGARTRRLRRGDDGERAGVRDHPQRAGRCARLDRVAKRIAEPHGLVVDRRAHRRRALQPAQEERNDDRGGGLHACTVHEPAPAIGPRPEPVADLTRIARVEHDRVEPEPAEAAEQLVETRLVRTCAVACFARAHPDVLHLPAGRVRDRKHDAADRRERLLPHRVLDNHRHDVPPQRAQPQPEARRHRHEEVRDDEDEAPGRAARGTRERVPRARRSTTSRARRRSHPRPRARAAANRVTQRAVDREDLALLGAALASIRRPAVSAAARLSSHGDGGAWIAIPGRRSWTSATRGACSAKNSRTTNSSVPRASDSLADAAQWMCAIRSPGR